MQQFWLVTDDRQGPYIVGMVSRLQNCIGPFETYAEAFEEWKDRLIERHGSRQSPYRIKKIDPDDPPPRTD